MSSGDTRSLIKQAVENLYGEVPALKQLKLVIRLELRAHGDVPIWRVEVPGPKITKDPAGDARIDVSVSRSHFNELAAEGTLRRLGGRLRARPRPGERRSGGDKADRQRDPAPACADLAGRARACAAHPSALVASMAVLWRPTQGTEPRVIRLGDAPDAIELETTDLLAGWRHRPRRTGGWRREPSRSSAWRAERDARRRLSDTLKRERKAARALHERAEQAEAALAARTEEAERLEAGARSVAEQQKQMSWTQLTEACSASWR